jgi:hypothetical protein
MTEVWGSGFVEAFRRDGYGSVTELARPGTIAALREAYDRVIDSDFGGHRKLGGITRQVMQPCLADPVFDDNEALDNGMAIARELLGTADVSRTFDMLIYKPPGHPHPTPWHQDAAYGGRPFAPEGTGIVNNTVQFWVALDDADEENGCMHFVPARHTGRLLEHRVASGDPDDVSRLLELTDPSRDLDLSTTVAVPLRAGGSTFHTGGTPHYTPPNRSTSRPRRAYIFNIG